MITNEFRFDSDEANPYFEGVFDIEANVLLRHLSKVVLIDVRQPEEFTGELGHIPGASLIVLDGLLDHIDDIPKDKPVVLICRSGGRSARAANVLFEAGYTNIYNLKGGMILWNELRYEKVG